MYIQFRYLFFVPIFPHFLFFFPIFIDFNSLQIFIFRHKKIYISGIHQFIMGYAQLVIGPAGSGKVINFSLKNSHFDFMSIMSSLLITSCAFRNAVYLLF